MQLIFQLFIQRAMRPLAKQEAAVNFWVKLLHTHYVGQ